MWRIAVLLIGALQHTDVKVIDLRTFKLKQHVGFDTASNSLTSPMVK